jgi:hypothetical protein
LNTRMRFCGDGRSGQSPGGAQYDPCSHRKRLCGLPPPRPNRSPKWTDLGGQVSTDGTIQDEYL